jgi:hypothetical protein
MHDVTTPFFLKHPPEGYPVIFTFPFSFFFVFQKNSNGKFFKFDLIQSVGFRLIQPQAICHHQQH